MGVSVWRMPASRGLSVGTCSGRRLHAPASLASESALLLLFLDLLFARAAKMLPPLAMALRPEPHWPAERSAAGLAGSRHRGGGGGGRGGGASNHRPSAANQERAVRLDRGPSCSQLREPVLPGSSGAHGALGSPGGRGGTPAIAAMGKWYMHKACTQPGRGASG